MYREAFFEASLFCTSLGFAIDQWNYNPDHALSELDKHELRFASEAWYSHIPKTEYAFNPLQVCIAMQGILLSFMGLRTQLTSGGVSHLGRKYFDLSKNDVRESLVRRSVIQSFHTWLTTEGLETIEFTFELAYNIGNGLEANFAGPKLRTATDSSSLHPVFLGRNILHRLGAVQIYGRLPEVGEL